ncbi:hypothetical protein NE865_09048 [Phthorimaea operculella]|nr:hypothetical protein NE865_09048 [Phthorimaea operculella]
MAVNLSDAQFKELLSKISAPKGQTLASCTARFDGTKNAELVEAFLAAVNVFKKIEKITDVDAIAGIPLLLEHDAAVWWQGSKKEVNTWQDFQDRLRHAFAPKKPEFITIQEIVRQDQKENERTEVFIRQKRMLLAQLSENNLSEKFQLNMVFGQLNLGIREKISRSSVTTFDELIEKAREAEQLLDMTKMVPKDKEPTPGDTPSSIRPKKKKRCSFCHFVGHAVEDCRKLKKKHVDTTVEPSSSSQVQPRHGKMTQAPSTSAPTFSCYGCGTPGFVRSNCPNCSETKRREHPKTDVSFCSTALSKEEHIEIDVSSRPVTYIEIEGIKGTAHMDTCAKSNVASYSLYQELRKKGHIFQGERVRITLADGVVRDKRVLKVKVPVTIEYKTVVTTFIVMPDSRDNRTLLGMPFLRSAHIIVDCGQFTWYFTESPQVVYELYDEKFVTFENEPEMDIHDITIEGSNSASAQKRTTAETSKEEPKRPYRLIPLALSPPKRKVFDGYAPHFADYMMRDAIENVHEAEIYLTPTETSLFPATGTNIDINSIDITSSTNDTIIQVLVSENIIPEITPKLMKLADNLLKARELNEKKEERRKQTVDESRRERPEYKPGDMVLVALHPISKASQGITAKFAPRRDGPYKILRQHGPTSFEVVSPSNPNQPIGVYHASALTPFRSEEGGTSTAIPEPVQPLRKRGRPKKVLTVEPSPVLPAQPKRGPGRPKKTSPGSLVGTTSQPEGEIVAPGLHRE